MIRAIAWKQWREHRLLAAVLLVVGASYLIILRSAGPQPRSQATIASLLFTVTLLAAGYGLIGGAMLLAGDREERAQGFLDQLTPSRLSLWVAKVLVGAGFTLLHSLLLALMLLSIWSDQLPPAEVLRQGWLIPLYALVAFGWGACASALVQTVPAALLLGGPLAVASVLGGWFLIRPDLLSGPGQAELLAGVVAAGAALLASALRYCRVDIRRSLGGVGQRPFAHGRSAASLRWLWLLWRQGWPNLLLLVPGPAVGWWLPDRALLFWPVVTLAGGFVIGSAVLEKRQGWEFLREQRLGGRGPWLPGTLARLLLAASFAGLVLGGAWLQRPKVDESAPKPPPFLERAMLIREEWLVGSEGPTGLPGNTAVFLTLWLLVGFSVGRLGILIFGSKAVTVGVGLPVAILLAGVWIPSILNQGLLWWQALMPCAVLLVGCVLADWGQGVLARRGKAILATSCLIVALGWVAGVLWHRATEIADSKEPFDVAEFAENLVPPEQDRVGRLLVHAAVDYRQHIITTTRQVGPPEAIPALTEGTSADRIKELQNSESIRDWEELYRLQLDAVYAKGWPDRATKLGRWVEGLCQGQWVRQLESLNDLPARMCLGRSSFWGPDPYTFELEGQTVRGDYLSDSREMAQLLHVRALQHQRRDQSRAALDCYRTILTLSRHLRKRGGTLGWLVGAAPQLMAFAGLEQWAYGVGEQALLLQALQELNRQEETAPPVVNLVCGEYYWLVRWGHSDPSVFFDRAVDRWQRRLYLLTRLAPWERERERRYLNHVYRGLLEEARLPTWEEGPAREGRARDLPPHPIARLPMSPSSYREAYGRGLCRLHGLRLQLALAIYQARHGRCPTSLGELAPELLRHIPADPWSGKPFGYRVSKGESLTVRFTGTDSWYERFPYDLFPVLDAFRWLPLPGAPGTPWITVVPAVRRSEGPALLPPGEGEDAGRPVMGVQPHRWVAPGRGIVWSTGPDRRDGGGKDEGDDTIFLVPYAIRPGRK
jgi:hypothetical protein